MGKLTRRLFLLIASIAVLTLTGCVDTRFIANSPIVETNLDQPYSTVYFLREDLGLNRGLPDDTVLVDINGNDLVYLAQGEYVMLRIKPIEATVRVRSWDVIGDNPAPQEIAGEETFNFAAGQTNFIRLKLVDGEFRGTYYVPERIESAKARMLAEKLKPVGEAKQHPISKL
ncbi:MAG: hypothetical protein AB1810_00590 [Pseudomonadota bacterium]